MRTAKVLVSGFAVVGVLAAGSAVLAQGLQRFPDVPPDHAAHEAIEWAAEVGVTTGYTDGTFKPERPLSKRHAVVFMERYYDEILRADESADFTRADMMQVLYEIAGRPGGWNLWDSSQAVAVHAAASIFADNAEFNMWVVCYEVADDPRGKHLAVELILPDNAGGVAPTIQQRFSTEDELTASRWELLPSTIFAVRLHGDVDAWLDRLSEATSLELHVHYSDDPNPTRAAFEWSNSFVVGQVRTACEDDPAQGLQRFPDVPPDHSAHNAIQWAAEVGVTTGYTDGTFKPEQPLSKRHAVVFMERYYHEILRADESADFTRADMMQVLYEIAGKPGSVDRSWWVPRPEGRTADGRCAAFVVFGIYEWEHCAWGSTPNPILTEAEARDLINRVWAETNARDKPDDPPQLALLACGDGVACYSDDDHTIYVPPDRILMGDVLHETAHALVSVERAKYPCDPWTEWLPIGCSHGGLFRCAADALYARYAGLESAGVCGEAPDIDPGGWGLMHPIRSDGLTVHSSGYIEADDPNVKIWLSCDEVSGDPRGKHVRIALVLPMDAGDAWPTIQHRFSTENQFTVSQWTPLRDVAGVGYLQGDVDPWLDRLSEADHLELRVHFSDDPTLVFFEWSSSFVVDHVRTTCQDASAQ